MNGIRHGALVLLVLIVVAQALFVARYGLGKYWRNDFVGRALFFKSVAVLVKAVVELALWWMVPGLAALIPAWLLAAVVLSDIGLAVGVTGQYLALERQKRLDRQQGTELGRETDHAAEG